MTNKPTDFEIAEFGYERKAENDDAVDVTAPENVPQPPPAPIADAVPMTPPESLAADITVEPMSQSIAQPDDLPDEGTDEDSVDEPTDATPTPDAPAPAPMSDDAVDEPSEPVIPPTSADADDVPRHRGWERGEPEEIIDTMPRRRFLKWLATAAGVGAVAAVGTVETGQSVLHYLTRDATLEELASRSKAQNLGGRGVQFTVPRGFEIGKNMFICARPVGAKAWDPINNIEKNVWLLAPNQFPEGGNIELSIGVLRNGEISFLNTAGLGTLTGLEKAR